MLNRVMPKDNIALAAVLKVKEAIYNSRKFAISGFAFKRLAIISLQ